METYCKHCGHRLGTVDNMFKINWISWKCRVCKIDNLKNEFIEFNYTFERSELLKTLRRAHHDKKIYLKLVRDYVHGR